MRDLIEDILASMDAEMEKEQQEANVALAEKSVSESARANVRVYAKLQMKMVVVETIIRHTTDKIQET